MLPVFRLVLSALVLLLVSATASLPVAQAATGKASRQLRKQSKAQATFSADARSHDVPLLEQQPDLPVSNVLVALKPVGMQPVRTGTASSVTLSDARMLPFLPVLAEANALRLAANASSPGADSMELLPLLPVKQTSSEPDASTSKVDKLEKPDATAPDALKPSSLTQEQEPLRPKPLTQEVVTEQASNEQVIEEGQLDEDASVAADADEGKPAKPVMVDISSKTLEYDENVGAYVATGLVHVVVSEQNSELEADKVTYDQDKDVLVAEGNVRITRNGEVTTGKFARVDLTRESALINDANTQVNTVRIKSETAYVDEEVIRLKNGKLIINRADIFANIRNMQGQGPQSGVFGNQQAAIASNEPLGDRTRSKKSDKKGKDASEPPEGESMPATTLDTSNNAQETPTSQALASQAIRGGFQPFMLNSPNALKFVDHDYLQIQQSADSEFLKFYEQDGLKLDTSSLASLEADDSNFKLTTRHVDVQQYPDNYQEITLKYPKVTYKGFPIFNYPTMDFGYDKDTGRIDYLGPEIGYNRDLGGLYAGPGFDFKAGPGVFKFSPLLTAGPEIDRDDGNYSQGGTQPGLGIMARYTDDDRFFEFARTTQVNYNVAYGRQRLFRNSKVPFLRSGITNVVASNNYSYSGNLLNGIERPAYSVQLTDDRLLFNENRFVTLRSHTSVGYFKDEFNPNNSASFFLSPTSPRPQTEGRAMWQMLAVNKKPLIQLTDNFDIGYMVQASGAAYTTGDHLAVLRGGPTANLRLGDRFLSQVYYALGATSGESPFVFDGYFLGRQAVTLNNAFRVNKYLTIGARNDLNLSRDNSQSDLLVGNIFYASVGPPDLKFNVGVDFVRRMTYFGLNFYPSAGFSTIDFDSANVFQASTSDPDGKWEAREKRKRMKNDPAKQVEATLVEAPPAEGDKQPPNALPDPIFDSTIPELLDSEALLLDELDKAAS